MQAQLLNPAGAALVRHIKWLWPLFFRCTKLASQKNDTFDILFTSCTPLLWIDLTLKMSKMKMI